MRKQFWKMVVRAVVAVVIWRVEVQHIDSCRGHYRSGIGAEHLIALRVINHRDAAQSERVLGLAVECPQEGVVSTSRVGDSVRRIEQAGHEILVLVSVNETGPSPTADGESDRIETASIVLGEEPTLAPTRRGEVLGYPTTPTRNGVQRRKHQIDRARSVYVQGLGKVLKKSCKSGGPI